MDAPTGVCFVCVYLLQLSIAHVAVGRVGSQSVSCILHSDALPECILPKPCNVLFLSLIIHATIAFVLTISHVTVPNY